MTVIDLQGHFRYCKSFRCLYLKKTTTYIAYIVYYNGQASYVSNYFYCRIRPEWLLYVAERDLLAIAKFPV